MTNERRTHRWVGITTFIIAIGLLAAACGGSGDSSGNAADNPTKRTTPPEDETVEPKRGGRLVVAVPAETNGWNPSINQWADAGSLVGASFIEPLTILDVNGDPNPWLAEKWTSNATFTEWEITLRPGVKFHNGQPVDGKALARNLTEMYTGGLTKVALESIYDRVEETGPLSAKSYLKKPWAQYPAHLNNAWMMAPEMLDRTDKGVVNPIGTGPFVFSEWQQNRFLRAKAFDNYWRKDEKGRKLPFLNEIEFQPIIDDDAKEKGLRAADVDMYMTTSADIAARADEDYTVLRDYTSERTLVMLNTTDSEVEGNKGNPFTNIHARKAMAYATDRVALADLAGEGVETRTQGYRPDSPWGVPEDKTGYPEYNPQKAKDELELYKKDTGKSTLSFTLTTLTTQEATKIAQAAQDQWRQVGIEAKIDAVDQTKYIINIALGQYQAGWFRWYGYLNPDFNYVYNAAEDAFPAGQLSINFTHYTSPTMQASLEDGRKTTVFEERKKFNDAVVRETNEAVINLWLYDTPYALVSNKAVKGLNMFRAIPFGNFSPKPWWGNVWLET